ETQIVANAEPYCEIIELGADEFISRRETNAFIEWRRSHEMTLSILGDHFAVGIDQDLSVKNRIAISIRYASDDGDRILFRDVSNFANRTISPASRVFLNHGH